MRDGGLYYVTYCGQWTVAQYNPNQDVWMMIGLMIRFSDEDFSEIGDRCPMPDDPPPPYDWEKAENEYQYQQSLRDKGE